MGSCIVPPYPPVDDLGPTMVGPERVMAPCGGLRDPLFSPLILQNWLPIIGGTVLGLPRGLGFTSLDVT